MANTLGRFVWYDLMTNDPKAAVRYYTSLLGWGTQDWQGGMPYTMFTNAGNPFGGVMELPEEAREMGAPPHWLAYVSTPDVDGTVAEAVRLGGKVYKGATDIPGAGRFAVLADPQGAVFASYTSPEDHPGDENAPAVGQFSWHELVTTDHDAAFGFYGKLFSWEKLEAIDMGMAGIYQMFGRSGVPLGGMYTKPAAMPAPPHWLLYVRVADIDRAIEQLRAKGGTLLNGPENVPGGDQVAQALDPQGVPFAVHFHKGQS